MSYQLMCWIGLSELELLLWTQITICTTNWTQQNSIIFDDCKIVVTDQSIEYSDVAILILIMHK